MRDVEMSHPFCDPVTNPVEGQACIAYHQKNNSWNRAQIVKVEPGQTKSRIHYVDFGSYASLPNTMDNIRKKEKDLSDPPFYATKVTLAKGIPFHGTTWEADVNMGYAAWALNKIFCMDVVENNDVMSGCFKKHHQSPF